MKCKEFWDGVTVVGDRLTHGMGNEVESRAHLESCQNCFWQYRVCEVVQEDYVKSKKEAKKDGLDQNIAAVP